MDGMQGCRRFAANHRSGMERCSTLVVSASGDRNDHVQPGRRLLLPLAAIAADKGLLAGISAVYLVDQGTDLISTRPLFSDDPAELGDKLVYLRQPNLGGSGGFTRGMYDILRMDAPANVILMGSTIPCEPETPSR